MRRRKSPGQVTDLLFVYGTLRVGFENAFARRLHLEAEYLGAAVAAGGVLVDLGWYPGFVPVANERATVRGDLFRLPANGKLLSLLDEYEGCSGNPANPEEYRRERRQVRRGNAGSETALIYILNRPAGNFPVVPDGDYLAYQRSKQRGPDLRAD